MIEKQFNDIYNSIVGNINNDAFFKEQDAKFKEQLDNWSLSPEMYAQKMTEYYIAQTQTILGTTQATVLGLLKADKEIDLTARKIQGYDDNILIKLIESQGGLASFAVNAGSDDAQTAITKLTELMCLAQRRVTELIKNENKENVCQPPPPPV